MGYFVSGNLEKAPHLETKFSSSYSNVSGEKCALKGAYTILWNSVCVVASGFFCIKSNRLGNLKGTVCQFLSRRLDVKGIALAKKTQISLLKKATLRIRSVTSCHCVYLYLLCAPYIHI